MIRVGILGDIGSGKSFVANTFGYPVFNADLEVAKLYNKNNKIYKELRKSIPKNILFTSLFSNNLRARGEIFASSFVLNSNVPLSRILASGINFNVEGFGVFSVCINIHLI